MKIKYTETTTKQIYLLDILKWKDEYDRETISYKTDSIEVRVNFYSDYKEVYVWIVEPNLTLSLDTADSSPEQVVGTIIITLGALGVEYER